VIAKVGDSNTVNPGYLQCFGDATFNLAGRETLRATIDGVRAARVAGVDPFRRVSLAAVVGWSAWAPLAGAPSPLMRELDATRARVATVMFGTNDIQARDLHRYGQNLLDLADQMIARGVVPIFTTIPSRADDAMADVWVPRYSAVMRAVAETRMVPLVDTHRELALIPRRGLISDGLHLNVYTVGGAARGCVFTPEGLQYGHNLRNLATITALDRVLDVVVRARTAPDLDAPRLVGSGTARDPYVVAALPFGDARDTSLEGTRTIERYACRPSADESGREVFYRIDVTRATRLRVVVITRGAVDVDVHLLQGGVTGDRCIARDDRSLVADLAPGAYYVVVDTYVASGAARAGEFLAVFMRDG
jgi:hypothetical protein